MSTDAFAAQAEWPGHASAALAPPRTYAELATECATLRAKLEDAEAVLAAIRGGEVDAVVVTAARGPQVYTLVGADQPYRIFVESMNEGAATLLSDGSLAYANGFLATLLQRPLERLAGAEFESFVVPRDRATFAAARGAAHARGSTLEVSLLRDDASEVPARIVMSPLRLESATPGPEALCLIVSDLTPARRQSELAAAWRAAHEREAQLRAADQQKDEFLAMLAHELRNPLAPIRHAATLLGRLCGDDERLTRPVAILDRQSAQLARLVDDLLDVSRIAQGRITLRREPIEIGEVIERAIESIRSAAPDDEPKQELTISRETDEALHVNGDLVRLVQCVGNLLNNAVKYSEPDGRIAISVRAEERWVEIAVSDDGCGIAPDLLPRVFDLFIQSERTLDRSQGGLGVGLSVVKRLVEMHGGAVAAASPGIGRGATFTLRLPRLAPDSDREPGH